MCYSAITAAGHRVEIATSMTPVEIKDSLTGLLITSDDEFSSRFSPDEIVLCLGIGSPGLIDNTSPRLRAEARFSEMGYRFTGFIHPSAWVAPTACVATTAQIHAGAMIQPNAVIGEHAIVNTGSSVDHDVRIGRFCHIAPGCTICGSVTIEQFVHVGPGTTIIPAITLHEGCFVGAGSTVVKTVPPHTRVRGTPARLYSSGIAHQQ